jgi:hypothetical protein
MINPVILGSGTPLFQGIHKKMKLKLLRSKEFENGNVLIYLGPEKPNETT